MTAPAPAALFPLESGRTKGYERRAVDEFLARARAQFETSAARHGITAGEVRSVAFPLVRHGYSIAAVDAALGRIEDAFARRERDAALSSENSGAWLARARARAQEILDRLSRPRGQRFDRVNWMRYGYRIDEVDIVADKIAAFFSTGRPVTAEQVRAVAFRMQRGGYSEAQVDAVLDAVVAVMLAVR